MRCPSCNSLDTQVKDSRPTEDSAVIRRRRVCVACNFRFTTFERVQLRELTVIKRNGRRVPFDRDKLARSVSVAMRKRPIEPERIDRLVSGLVRQIESSGESEITSAEIGELAASVEAMRHAVGARVGELELLNRARQSIAAAAGLDELLGETARYLAEAAEATSCSISLWDTAGERLAPAASYGDAVAEFSVSGDLSLGRMVAGSPEPVSIRNVRTSTLLDAAVAALAEFSPVRRAIDSRTGTLAADDVADQVGNLIFDGFVDMTALPAFRSIPRYLPAARLRAEDRHRRDGGRDRRDVPHDGRGRRAGLLGEAEQRVARQRRRERVAATVIRALRRALAVAMAVGDEVAALGSSVISTS